VSTLEARVRGYPVDRDWKGTKEASILEASWNLSTKTLTMDTVSLSWKFSARNATHTFKPKRSSSGMPNKYNTPLIFANA
jgi:hypothetical protein